MISCREHTSAHFNAVTVYLLNLTYQNKRNNLGLCKGYGTLNMVYVCPVYKAQRLCRKMPYIKPFLVEDILIHLHIYGIGV